MKEEREGKKRRGGRSRVGVVMIIKTGNPMGSYSVEGKVR